MNQVMITIHKNKECENTYNVTYLDSQGTRGRKEIAVSRRWDDVLALALKQWELSGEDVVEIKIYGEQKEGENVEAHI